MTAHPCRTTRGTSLALVLIAAKTIGTWDRDLPDSVWLLPVLFRDDVAVGVIFWAIDRALRRPRWMWTPYAVIVAWTALNAPIVRTLSSAMTWPMLRAARGPLADSVRHHLTLSNIAAVVSLAIVAAVLPSMLPRAPRAFRAGLAMLGVAVLVGGFAARSSVDLEGRERNAITAIVASWHPAAGVSMDGDWRTSPVAGAEARDLSLLRGTGRGMNVLLIALESTASRYLHSYGAADDPTPNLTALARQSLQFDRAYAVYPESIKGLFSVLCSRDPAFDVAVEVLARSPCSSLVSALAANGYRTALFHSGRFAYLGMDAVVAGQRFDVAADAGTIGGRIESSFGVDEASTVARALSWIDADRQRPFFLTYLPVAGHHPYATSAPGPFIGDDEPSAYKNALHGGDAALGTLFAGLRERGLEERTLVVAYSDHGEAFGQHDGNVGHTMFLYDENVRVPLLVSVPGAGMPSRVPNVASVIDIAPTILDLLGLPRSPAHRGASLVGDDPRIALFYTDYSMLLAGLQDGCWKYILQLRGGGSKLFDTCTDPDETRNLAAAEPLRVRAYRERAESWIRSRRAALENF